MRQASEQASLDVPLCTASLLLLHDAVDLFLGLACEHLRAVPPPEVNPSFDDCLDLLRGAMGGRELAHRRSMATLDMARLWLVHYGSHPPRTQLAQYVVRVEDFLTENVRDLFGLEFQEVSMLPLVAWPPVRRRLEAARAAIREDRYREAVEETAKAFGALLDGYRRRRDLRSRGRPVLRPPDPLRSAPDLESFSLAVAGHLDPLHEQMLVFALGLDAAAHRRFRSVSPAVLRAAGLDDLEYETDWGGEPVRMTPAHAESCLDFVIESAVRVQDAAVREGLRDPPSERSAGS